MVRKVLIGSLTLGLAATIATMASAQAPAPPAAQAPTAPVVPDPFTQAMTARQVADFARRQKDPQAMIVAARMLQEVPFIDQSGAPAPDGSAAAFTSAGLFDEARALAKNDPAMLTQIRVAQSTGSRGVFDSMFGKGLVRLVRQVAANSVLDFDIRAVGGQVLRIGAIGDLGTAMVLRLVDAAGKVACIDDNNDYAPVCALTPRATASYKVRLLNRSRVPSRTVILSN